MTESQRATGWTPPPSRPSGRAVRSSDFAGARPAHRHVDRDLHRAADPAAFGRLLEPGQLSIVEGTVDEQLSLDAGDLPLSLRRGEASLDPAQHPLLALGEPPNVADTSGADGAEQQLRG